MYPSFQLTLWLLLFATLSPIALAVDEGADVVEKLLVATGAHAQHKQMIQTLLQNMDSGFQNGMKSALEKQSLTPEQKDISNKLIQKHLAGFTLDIREYLNQKMRWDDLVEKVYTPLYLRHFTINEMKVATMFFESEVGKKFTSAAPALMQEASTQFNTLYGGQMQAYVAERMQSRMAALLEDFKTLCKKDC